MWCCSRKTLYILLAVAGLLGLLIATGKINAYAIIPYLPLLACPLMCAVPMLFMRKKGQNGMCDTPQKKAENTSTSIIDVKS